MAYAFHVAANEDLPTTLDFSTWRDTIALVYQRADEPSPEIQTDRQLPLLGAIRDLDIFARSDLATSIPLPPLLAISLADPGATHLPVSEFRRLASEMQEALAARDKALERRSSRVSIALVAYAQIANILDSLDHAKHKPHISHHKYTTDTDSPTKPSGPVGELSELKAQIECFKSVQRLLTPKGLCNDLLANVNNSLSCALDRLRDAKIVEDQLS